MGSKLHILAKKLDRETETQRRLQILLSDILTPCAWKKSQQWTIPDT